MDGAQLDLAALESLFLAEARQHLEAAAKEIEALRDGGSAETRGKNLIRAFHSLRGDALLVGFQSVGELSGLAEDFVRRVVERPTQEELEWLGLLTEVSRKLDELLRLGRRGNDEAVSDALISRLKES